MKKLRCFSCWFLIMLLLLLSAAVSAAEKPLVEIDIYSINDFHGHLRAEGTDPGISCLSATVNALMKQNPTGSLLLGGGDMFSGTIDANEYQGMTSVMAMNRMPFAANVAGNHIFDYPLDVIKKQASAAQFPLLSANILAVETGKVAEPFQPYSLLTRNGLTIGVVGLTTGETKTKVSQANLKGLKILPPEQVAQQYINEVRSKGADIVVLLTHIGSVQGDGSNVEGEIVPVLQKLHGFDAVVTAHSHLCVSGTVAGVPVVQAGCYGEAVGRIHLLYSRAEKKVVAASTRVYKLADLPRLQDAAMEKLLEPIFKDVDAKYNTVLAVNQQLLTNDRNDASMVGDYFMDLLQSGFKADVALYNGGAVRDVLPAGTVTARTLIKIFPFDSTLYVGEVKGSDLRQVFEHGLGNAAISRLRFAGVQVTADVSKPEGQRISRLVLADGSAVVDDKYYKVVSNDFMFSGGDGFGSLKNARNLRDCGKDKVFFSFALRSFKTINYSADSRLQLIGRGEKNG
ncbi:5'-nucleotidase C-terminal domain-containing protein [Phascolarctobacterium sp.]|uniref:bifunctional metallophosphatase/5'-nucleotidase n=1 Tax=Phascolarctobacterium sp. TaxID=2049039 RepID=UPI003077B88E